MAYHRARVVFWTKDGFQAVSSNITPNTAAETTLFPSQWWVNAFFNASFSGAHSSPPIVRIARTIEAAIEPSAAARANLRYFSLESIECYLTPPETNMPAAATRVPSASAVAAAKDAATFRRGSLAFWSARDASHTATTRNGTRRKTCSLDSIIT